VMVKSGRMRWAGHIACMVKRKVAYRFLVGKTKIKRPLGRRKHRLEGKIKTELKSGMGAWTGLIWLRIRTGDGLL